MLCCIIFLHTSLITRAAYGSIYNGTYIDTFTSNASVVFDFDQEVFNSISAINGSIVEPASSTAGAISGNINHLSTYDHASLTIADYGQTDSVTLSVTNSQGVYYTNSHLSITTGTTLTGIDVNKYYECIFTISNVTTNTGRYNTNTPIVRSFADNKFYPASFSRHVLLKGSDLLYAYGGRHYFLYLVEFQFDVLSPTSASGTITWDTSCEVYEISKDAYESNAGTTVNDGGTQSKLDTNNQIAQDSNDTAHDTNNKITDFFNGFFDNLIGVFVPESGFFSQWFSDLNTFMSQKLGFLWSPFDFIISFLNGVYSGSGSASITFPELAWIDGTVIIPETQFSFDNIGGQSFTDLRDMIYFATDVILLGAVVAQFYQKIKLVFEGGSD